MEKKTCRGLVNVVDECNFGRTGLATLLRNALTKNSQSITWEICEASTLIDLFSKRPPRGVPTQLMQDNLNLRLIIRLSKNIQSALVTLLLLGGYKNQLAGYDQVLLLTPFSMEVEKRILTCIDVPSNLYIVNDRNNCLSFIVSSLIQCDNMTGDVYRVNAHDKLYILSQFERLALLQTIQGWSIYQQARYRHVSIKTVYAHRHSALTKLRFTGMLALLKSLTAI